MNLDPAQAQLILILAYCLRDGIILILAFVLIGRIVNAQSCRYVPVPVPGPGPAPGPQPPGPIPPEPVPVPTPVPIPTIAYGPGKCSWFGGPDDTGVSPSEGLAIIDSISQAPAYFLPTQPEGTTGLARRLDPHTLYIACRWNYGQYGATAAAGKAWLRTHKCTVTASKTGTAIRGVQPVDWGPASSTNRVADLSPGLMSALGIVTDDIVTVQMEAPPGKAVTPTPPIVDGLIKNAWPTQADCPVFYGSPSQVVASLVHVHCPWVFTVEGTQSQTITIHSKCAPSLTRIMNYIWNHPAIGQSQAHIHEFGYDVFDGSYYPRNIAGTNTPSIHSYGAAMDWNAAKNGQHEPLKNPDGSPNTKFQADPISLIVYAFEAEGWIWGGRWSSGYIDAMHFQAARVR